MRIPASFKPSTDGVRFFAIGLAGIALAACSSDVSRFSDSGSSAGNRPANDVTNSSSASSRPSGQPVAQIESRPLDQPAYAQNGTPVYGPAVYGQNNQPQQGGYQPNPSYQPTPSYQPQPQYSNAPYSPPAGAAPQYTPVSDTTGSLGSQNITVTLKKGETIHTLASRYNVSVSAILRENNLADASRVRPGTRLVIPSRMTQSASHQPAASRGTVHTVAPRETLASISRQYHVGRSQIASENHLNEYAALKVGQKLTIPGGTVANNTQSLRRAEVPLQQQAPQKQIAQNGPADSVATIKPVEDPEPPVASAGGAPSFRWPVKGRVISNFGGKPNGQQNDGINISVPENTAVKSSEDGVVAYAGNELKGYGNLVLVRHTGGWVTAYAHNSEILVHKGETVKRGQVIAKAGQTGGVAAPQVHFEIRKGSTPVDPAQHLSSL